MKHFSQRVFGIIGILGAVLYMAYLLRIHSGYLDPRTSYVSELAARDQPQSGLFRLTDLVSGTLLTIFAVGLWRDLRPYRTRFPHWTLMVGCVCLGGWALSTMLLALLPMDCAPSAELACHRAETAGTVSWIHKGHEVVSVVAGVTSLLAMFLLGMALRNRPGWRIAGWAGLLIMPLAGGLCVAMAIGALRDASPGWAWFLVANLGVMERAQLTLLGLWAILPSCSLLLSSRACGASRASRASREPPASRATRASRITLP
jgi:hypothetical protein